MKEGAVLYWCDPEKNTPCRKLSCRHVLTLTEGGVCEATFHPEFALTDENGKLRDSETVYWELIDALGNVEDETERDALAIVYGGGTVLIDPSRRLNIWDPVLNDRHFTRPSVQVILSTAGQRIKALVIPSLPRDGQLLPGVTEDDDYERQAYDKPYRLDGGV